MISKAHYFYLAALSMIGYIATDMYLPAFQSIQGDLNTDATLMALTLSLFLGGFAVGQILWGRLTDRYGRVSSLVVGLGIFTLSSLAISVSDSITQLLVFRFTQAIGVCAPAVIWQAMVISQYQGDERQRVFANIMPLVALSPAIAPQIGVLLDNTFGWHSIFVSLVVIGAALFYVTTRQPIDKPNSKPAPFTATVKQLIKRPAYSGNVLMYAATSASFFAYLTAIPELMSSLGYSSEQVGMSFIPQTVAFILGGQIGKVMTARFGSQRYMLIALAVYVSASVAIFVLTQQAMNSIVPLISVFCFIALCNGGLYPVLVNRALSTAPQQAATAAGFQNFLQISLCSLASTVVALFASHIALAAGWVILLSCATTLIGLFWSMREQALQLETEPS